MKNPHLESIYKMNVEHRTSNVEHRIMHSTIYNKDKATRGASACAARAPSTFDVRRWTFDVRCSNCCIWNYD